MSEKKFPPRVLRWEHTPEGTTLDFDKKHDIFLSAEKICAIWNYKYTDEYLSIEEHNYLIAQAKADAFEDAALMLNTCPFETRSAARRVMLEKALEFRGDRKE